MERVASDANLIINTTTIGYGHDAEGSPWPDGLPFPPNALVFDLAPGPCDTHFLRQAQASGARTVSRLDMLLYEIAAALERWTGYRPSTEILWHVATNSSSQQMLNEPLLSGNGSSQTAFLDEAAQVNAWSCSE
jgi:shikimate 5-dehydrogenase